MLEQQFIQFNNYRKNLYTGDNPLTIPADADNNLNYRVIARNLQNGAQYLFTIEESVRDTGATLKYTVLLYDFNTSVAGGRYTLLVGEGHKELVIAVPATGTWNLLVYAGLQGSTKGIGMTFTDIMVTQKMVLTQGCEMALPYCDQHSLTFSYQTSESPIVDIVRPNGDLVAQHIADAYQHTDDGIYVVSSFQNLNDILAPNECFRLCMRTTEGLNYSNLLCYMGEGDDYLSSLQYYCHEPQFGFPFGKFWIPAGHWSGIYFSNTVQVALPIHLAAAQYKQTDKIYENRNGEQIVLYATIQKEYEGETDYIPESWHEKIVTALSCDEVYINKERVTKSDSYEIDHDNYTYSDCGIRLTRATFKVKTNVIQRNSNC